MRQSPVFLHLFLMILSSDRAADQKDSPPNSKSSIRAGGGVVTAEMLSTASAALSKH
jgi:hypothetical protein